MSIIWTIIVGFIIGVLAKFIHPGRDNLGMVMTTVLGVAGSILATYLGQALGLYQAGQPAGFIGGIIGAILLLFIYGRLSSKSTATGV